MTPRDQHAVSRRPNRTTIQQNAPQIALNEQQHVLQREIRRGFGSRWCAELCETLHTERRVQRLAQLERLGMPVRVNVSAMTMSGRAGTGEEQIRAYRSMATASQSARLRSSSGFGAATRDVDKNCSTSDDSSSDAPVPAQ